MTDVKYQARLQVLSQWATEAAGQGHLVPRIADLEATSAARTVDAPGVSRETVEPWLPTIQWLLKQAAFGVVDAHAQLSVELSRPVAAAQAAQDVPAAEDPGAASAPPAMDVSLVAVLSPDTEHGSGEAVTVVAEIKPTPPIVKGPKWETEAHVQVKRAVQRFSKPLHDLLARGRRRAKYSRTQEPWRQHPHPHGSDPRGRVRYLMLRPRGSSWRCVRRERAGYYSVVFGHSVSLRGQRGAIGDDTHSRAPRTRGGSTLPAHRLDYSGRVPAPAGHNPTGTGAPQFLEGGQCASL